MGLEDDSVQALHWLANQPERQGLLWDSDVMRAHDWGEERARLALGSLERDGCIICREVPLGTDRVSVGFLQVTRAGLRRLRKRLA